jgi:predicted DNA binding CopG/RHH family protein
MKDIEDEYDFSGGKRGAILPVPPGKTRITIRIDDDILDWFRLQVDRAGGGNYQTMINEVLRAHIEVQRESLEKLLRRVIREEMARKRVPRAPKRQLRRPSAAWRKK